MVNENLLTMNADVVFEHRGIQCWVKEIKTKKSPFLHSCNGYFRMFIPDVQSQDELTELFTKSGGDKALPNGDRFSYFVTTGAPDEVVAGFDGGYEHNIKAPVFKDMAKTQIIRAVDFLLDNKLGFIFTSRVDV